MKNLSIILCLLISLSSFSQQTIESKFSAPEGYKRVYNDGYSKFLRQFPLKSNNVVKYYDGETKFNNNIWSAVFDYDIGNTNLHQCADAAIYLRASYHYSTGQLDKLKYRFTNCYQSSYIDYLKGNKIKLLASGTDIRTFKGKPRKDSCTTFRKWLDQVWMYAGTYSVEKYDTQSVDIWEMKPGDLFVQGGFPGHIISVVDMAKNKKGHTVYMLAQSYMPAQEHQILKNPKDRSVWYHLDESEVIQTPEYPFRSNQLRRWR